ncbi:MAG: GPW/gp25 family protein [Synergistaceae bacterium]|jgi:predicted component of type VI protein secretion system|nr:GPW/gp25 family protein [Synergistaceae bacterium]
MQYLVSGAANAGDVNFSPVGMVEEVLQNVRTLLTTIKHSVPLDRELGIDAAFLDKPAPDGMARLRVQIAREIQRFEPRAVIKIVEFKRYENDALAGTFYPVARIEVIGG